MATTEHLLDVVQRLTRRWDERDIDGVLRYYSEDVRYEEPGAGVVIHGRQQLSKYLSAYFQAWDSRWTIQEHYRLEGQDAIIALWDMEVWRPGDSQRILTKGMDILFVRGDEVISDVVYFDRTQLRPLLQTASS
ncbi:nuclear transport factor 2 family protein [Bradyrhizobium liaoningense]